MVEFGPDLSGWMRRSPKGRRRATRWFPVQRRVGLWTTVEATSEAPGDCYRWSLSSTRFLLADQIHSTDFSRLLVFLEKGGNRHHSTVPRPAGAAARRPRGPAAGCDIQFKGPQTRRWRGRPALANSTPGRTRRSGRFPSGVQGRDALATSVGEPQVLVEMVDTDLPAQGAV